MRQTEDHVKKIDGLQSINGVDVDKPELFTANSQSYSDKTGKNMKKTIYCVALACFITGTVLSGCTAVAIGGATYATTTAVGTIIDRRTTGTIVDDELLEKKISYEISNELGKSVNSHITVTCYNRRVLLTGEISSQHAQSIASKVAAESTGVREVINELRVQDNAGIFERMGDSTLATKVRTRIVANQKVELNQMKIAVDRGIVYIIGILTAQENKTACEIAASTSGVVRVVSCAEIVTPEQVQEQMRQLQNNQNKASGDIPQ